MSADPKPTPQSDLLDPATDQAIAACEGDVRAAIRALIVAKDPLEVELWQPQKDTRGVATKIRRTR
ncbi:hypothetical protein [Bradyrhizobium elkanii]|uniref:Uncharacterized protein n=1 Tax=Bradyrhizobium elkanii TaxID=29448 RepID=A0ABV4FC19_BRAEL|nr:hypothetical protein [Bradyrhizobium elkanii]MCP1751988.1 hypothetical protein [Bradyrhizobium elkanii]MCP1977759.1 hypothetical protein [Bradyrhizobium elkanii]MCS3887724.1 hypothetical protein [Bradyrhizobium elkanii]MCS4213257.1 hypothetical protein [Bradyrhizobium elkanii]MCW2213564.1 hypothetical protein [Bradyrhizobium elkanii]